MCGDGDLSHECLLSLESLPCTERAFTSSFYKKNYFTISKATLSFIPYHFIIQSTSQLLFYHSAHQNNINYTIKLYKIIYHSFLIFVYLSLFQPHLYTATTFSTTPPPHNNHRDPKPTTILANTNL